LGVARGKHYPGVQLAAEVTGRRAGEGWRPPTEGPMGGRRKRERGTEEDRWAVEGGENEGVRVTRGSRMPKPL
jgi:hypothetical protein